MGSASQKGILQVDGTTITATGGVISAVGGGGSLTVTDGTNTVSGTTQITFSGATVGGSSPNATVTVTGGGGAGATNPGANYVTPTLGSFTWVNQGTSTASQAVSGQAIQASPQNNTSVNWRLLTINAPSTPYKVRVQRGDLFGGGASQVVGLAFYDGTKIFDIEQLVPGNAMGWRQNTNVNSAGSFNSSGIVAPSWFQIRNDGTTLYFDYSVDGQNFTNLTTSPVGTFITPTKVAWAFLNVVSSGSSVLVAGLLNWHIYNDANLN